MRRGLDISGRCFLVVAIVLVLLPVTVATAQEASAPKTQPKPTRLGTMTKGNIGKSKGGFRLVLEAARKLETAKAAYATNPEALWELLAAQQAVTNAQIQYMSATTDVRGNAPLRDYLTLRGEVSARERGLAEVTQLLEQVPESQTQQVRDELKRRTEILELARKELANAELTWKTADRANQFRYLNRRALNPR